MSEPENEVEKLTTKVSNLENDVATLTGENDRLNSELKVKDSTIVELQHTQESLEAQIKAAEQPKEKQSDTDQAKYEEKDRQAQHIIDLENKLKSYQDFESSKTALEKDLQNAKAKSEQLLKELVENKAKHELEVKELRQKITDLSSQAPKEEHNSEMNQLVEIKIDVIASDDAAEEDFTRDENSNKEMSEK